VAGLAARAQFAQDFAVRVSVLRGEEALEVELVG
jgi:hypothetical protein